MLINAIHLSLKVADNALQWWFPISLPQWVVDYFVVHETKIRGKFADSGEQRPETLRGAVEYLHPVRAGDERQHNIVWMAVFLTAEIFNGLSVCFTVSNIPNSPARSVAIVIVSVEKPLSCKTNRATNW